MPEQDPAERIRNFSEVALGYTLENALNEAERCLVCAEPDCIPGCPVEIDIPGFIAKITEKDYRGAYDILTQETRPLFPEGTNLTIANNDWQVSPDGRKIALVAAGGTELDGIWVIDIEPEYVVFSE